MSRAINSVALLSVWTLLGLGTLCAAGSAEARSTIKKADLRFDLSPLAPAVKASLKKIDVLVLNDDNLFAVWKLEKKPQLADVIVVACSPACLSTDILEALANWAKGGGGLFLEASAAYMASRFLLPESYFIEPIYLRYARGYAWLEKGGPLTSNVRQIRKELWCSRDGTGRLKLRSDSEDEQSLEQALFNLGETFLPVLTWKPAPRESTPVAPVFGTRSDSGDATADDDSLPAVDEGLPTILDDSLPAAPDEGLPVLFASTYDGARVVWYAHDFTKKKDCSPEFDDVRLWSNLVHWLARKELGDHPSDSSSAR